MYHFYNESVNIGDLFVRNLNTLLRDMDLTPTELARRAGVSQAYLSAMQLRKRTPTIKILEKLARPLGIAAWQLIAPDIELRPDQGADRLADLYRRLDDAGRDALLRIAEAQAAYKPRSD